MSVQLVSGCYSLKLYLCAASFALAAAPSPNVCGVRRPDRGLERPRAL